MEIQERLTLFFSLLANVAPASNHDEAFELIARLLNEVEDTHSGILANPEAALAGPADGRMYPPHPNFRRTVRPGLVRYRTKGHKVTIRENGSIEICTLNDEVVMSKLGSDGKGVGEA